MLPEYGQQEAIAVGRLNEVPAGANYSPALRTGASSGLTVPGFASASNSKAGRGIGSASSPYPDWRHDMYWDVIEVIPEAQVGEFGEGCATPNQSCGRHLPPVLRKTDFWLPSALLS